MNHDLPNIRAAAQAWRKNHPDHAAGHVIVRGGPIHQATGWTLTPIATNFPPGTYSVNSEGGVAVASGGDEKTGAARWAILDLIAPSASVGLSGGQISPADREEISMMRARIKGEADVYDVLELSRRCDGTWLYLIRTPLEWTFPAYVIGRCNAELTEVSPMFKCAAEWSARAEWHKHRHGCKAEMA
jgi:hypothetical protein